MNTLATLCALKGRRLIFVERCSFDTPSRFEPKYLSPSQYRWFPADNLLLGSDAPPPRKRSQIRVNFVRRALTRGSKADSCAFVCLTFPPPQRRPGRGRPWKVPATALSSSRPHPIPADDHGGQSFHACARRVKVRVRARRFSLQRPQRARDTRPKLPRPSSCLATRIAEW